MVITRSNQMILTGKIICLPGEIALIYDCPEPEIKHSSVLQLLRTHR